MKQPTYAAVLIMNEIFDTQDCLRFVHHKVDQNENDRLSLLKSVEEANVKIQDLTAALKALGFNEDDLKEFHGERFRFGGVIAPSC